MKEDNLSPGPAQGQRLHRASACAPRIATFPGMTRTKTRKRDGAASAGRLACASVTAAAVLSASCSGGGAARGSGTASEAEWQSLALPRPSPLPGAVRLSLAEMQLLAAPPWPAAAAVPPALGLSELVSADLLRRADVQFVERRRFAAVVDAERDRVRRRPGAPAAGVSSGAELLATVVWVPLSAGQASLEVRLTETATGVVAGTNRLALPADADPVSLARATVAAILAGLERMGRLPAWDDPDPSEAPRSYLPSGVPPEALIDFLRGLAAEEQWSWEPARSAYQAAQRRVGFIEAGAALARTARLRAGGTLGES
jgi:hypothetical protein